MSWRSIVFRLTRHASRKSKLITGSAGILFGASVGLKWDEWSNKKKDKVLFLSSDENSKPSQADIESRRVVENRSEPVLSDGKINWACQCIEKDVVGPCNVQFRALREFMHEHDVKEDARNLPDDLLNQFDLILEDYINCTLDYPVYYRDALLKEELEDLERDEQARQAEEERKRKEKEENTRKFGKDTVMFLSEEENQVPTNVIIPTRDDLEEYRAPLLPDGSINWACGCIEKDVIGPCNVEFREFRQFIHDAKEYKDKDMPIEKQEELHEIIGRFLGCAKRNPVYYSSLLNKKYDEEDDNDLDEPTESTEPENEKV